ncbi:MAG: hypothetical protein JWR61_1468 [Ferruginibacter sp.]|jgi:hypothetical protein|uniref:DUF4386 domain-containing protein n=1 Tax=Ferruginibacter sp. TaxID=1940288 RepID=UPI00265B3420|nr:DUF4386 domain-containing protein [Ferruginibacter sp.]MDB5276513.1 hypothetical protein [Ferruginibacter sp.]
MTNSKEVTSPQFYARTGGLAYLIIIVAGALGELFIRNAMIVPGDAAATARHIAASPFLWRIGIAGDLAMHVCDLVLAIVYFTLFKRVNKNLAILSVLFGLIQTAVLVANKLNLMLPLFFLGNAAYLKAFDPQQLQALAAIAIEAHEHGFAIGLIFFGFECLIDGYLIFKSVFLPKFLGIFILTAGLCYLVNSFTLILFPEFAGSIFNILMAPIFIAELSMCLWLLIKGVNVPKWNSLVNSQPAV